MNVIYSSRGGLKSDSQDLVRVRIAWRTTPSQSSSKVGTEKHKGCAMNGTHHYVDPGKYLFG